MSNTHLSLGPVETTTCGSCRHYCDYMEIDVSAERTEGNVIDVSEDFDSGDDT